MAQFKFSSNKRPIRDGLKQRLLLGQIDVVDLVPRSNDWGMSE